MLTAATVQHPFAAMGISRLSALNGYNWRMKPRAPLALSLLLLATLACNALNPTQSAPTPAPPTQPTRVSTAIPAPSQTLGASQTPRVSNETSTPAQTLGVSETPGVSTATPAPNGTSAVSETPGAASMPFTLDSAANAQAAMLPQFAADVQTLPDASRYVIDVTITFDGARSATLTGRELIRYTNRQTNTLDSLMLMLWPNDSDQFLGHVTLGAVTVGGASVQPSLESRGLAARLPLATPLAPGQRVDLTADFTAQANDGAEQGARYGLTHGVLVAPTFYPIIPRIVNGQWQSQWPNSQGDVSNSDTAFYAYRVTAPAHFGDGQSVAIAASGVVISQSTSADTQTQTVLTGPMRDIALAVGGLSLTQRTTPEGIKVNAWTLPEHAAQGPVLADEGANQVQNLEAEVGPYPFGELDIVDTPGTYGGVEYPGLVYIGVVDVHGGFEAATVHEVGHQWFYSVIGDDQLLQPWLDEAAASYTEVLYAEKFGGAAAARAYLANFQGEAASASDPNQPIGLPVDRYSGLNDYAGIVYGKGALFFDALRQQLGDAVFFKFLHNYYQQYKYGFADSAGFERVAETTCACDLKPMFQKWVFGNP